MILQFFTGNLFAIIRKNNVNSLPCKTLFREQYIDIIHLTTTYLTFTTENPSTQISIYPHTHMH